jgi:superfamily I DNA/RNA helicase
MRTWSKYQEAIFEFAQNGTGNGIVKAVAGSGKTTTIVEAISRLKGTTLFLAFNKTIATELQGRGVNARTFHSLCYSPVLRYAGAKTANQYKLKNLIQDNLGDEDVRMYGEFMQKLVSLAKQSGIGCLVEDTESEWMEIVSHHSLELDSEKAEMPRAIDLSRRLLAASNRSSEIDFDDMLYRAVKDGIALPQYDNVLVDEAQDTNAIQRAVLRKILKANGRMIAVGDPGQAIYGFRGADSQSMALIAQEFSCTELPLTVSYRCPTAVIDYAKQWVPHIESAPGAAAGKVEQLRQWGNEIFAAGDLVVCRTTAPLIGLAYSLLRQHIPAKVLGRDIAKGLKTLVEKQNTLGIDRLIAKLLEFTDREVEKAIAQDKLGKAESIRDKTDAVLCLIDGLVGAERTVPGLLRLIDSLFTEATNAVTLSTIHKAKGLEAKRVFWLDRSKCPAKWVKKAWEREQEDNLCYVAATRAQEELYLIDKADVRPSGKAAEGKSGVEGITLPAMPSASF